MDQGWRLGVAAGIEGPRLQLVDAKGQHADREHGQDDADLVGLGICRLAAGKEGLGHGLAEHDHSQCGGNEEHGAQSQPPIQILAHQVQSSVNGVA